VRISIFGQPAPPAGGLGRRRAQFFSLNAPGWSTIIKDRARVRHSLFVAGCALAVLLSANPGVATTFVVNSTGDDPEAMPGDGVCATAAATCTLRAAIEEANAHSGLDTIDATGTSGTIHLRDTVQITDVADVVGPASLSGAVATGGITSQWPLTIDGGGTVSDGLVIRSSAGGTSIVGLAFTAFPARSYMHGAVLVEGNGNTIKGNYLHGDGRAIVVTGDGNTIGGTHEGDGNLINDNSEAGISITGNANVVVGNISGSDGRGTVAHPNHNGVSIGEPGSHNRIGGITPEERNLLSGSEAFGIHVDGPRCVGNLIEGNFVGVAIDGATPLCDLGASILDEGTDTTVDDNVEACRILGCCAYDGSSTLPTAGITCIDVVSGKIKTRMTDTDCAILDRMLDGNAHLHVNSGSNCLPAGDPGGTCPSLPPGEPTYTPAPPPPTLTPASAPPTPTATASPSETPLATATATTEPTVAACIGDCDTDASVRVNELIQGVGIELGAAELESCSAFDANRDGAVTINELVAAVSNALFGCH
jgi:CSLREA domain-containing protein